MATDEEIQDYITSVFKNVDLQEWNEKKPKFLSYFNNHAEFKNKIMEKSNTELKFYKESLESTLKRNNPRHKEAIEVLKKKISFHESVKNDVCNYKPFSTEHKFFANQEAIDERLKQLTEQKNIDLKNLYSNSAKESMENLDKSNFTKK